MPRPRALLIFAVIAILFLAGQFLFTPKEYMQSALRDALLSPRIVFDALRNKSALVRQLKDLGIENQALRGEIAELAADPARIEARSARYLRAGVYSTYPLTSMRTLTIHAGASDGVIMGQSVELSPGLFIGVVSEVYEHQSVVRTLFSSVYASTTTSWQLPVRVGAGRTDALLVTGVTPKLTIISRKKGVTQGDTVTLAAQEFPLGLSVGSVGAVIDDPTSVFLEAELAIPYTLGAFSEVLVRLE